MHLEKLETCPYCGSVLSQAQYDGQFCGCGWPDEKTFVIALNDYAHEIHKCYSEGMARERCRVLKEEYIKEHPHVNTRMVYFHAREVPITRQPLIHTLREQAAKEAGL